jgi:hypothetical protein
MPIRTNRGRAAVYRRLWGWPLRSPRHLVVAIVGAAVVAVAVAVVTTNATASARHGSSAAGTGSSSVTMPAGTGGSGMLTTGTNSMTTPVQTIISSPPETPRSAPPAPAALTVITTWGRLWVNHPAGMTNQQWLAQLRPYTTPEFLPQMGTVDVANISATQVTGDPTPTRSYTSSVEALLPTNAGQLDITAIDTPQGWLVSAYTEAP